MLLEGFKLFYTFLKLGFISFGGGYAMLSMIMTEAQKFSVTPTQLADMNALDMVVPGAIAINAATYVGYLHQRIYGAIAATVGVSLPSFILTVIIMRFVTHYKDNVWLEDALSGMKPAAVGLIAAASITIAADVLILPGMGFETLLTNPLGTISLGGLIIFILTAVLNIRFKINAILLTALAGVAGALFL